MYVLAVDPGPHTGIALFNGWERLQTVTLETKPDLPIEAIYRSLERLIQFISEPLVVRKQTDGEVWYHEPIGVDESDLPVVVIERFYTASPAVGMGWSGTTTAKLCGFIEGTALLHNCRVAWQTPSDRIPYVPAARQMTHSSVHEISALAHGLRYLEMRQKALGDV